MDKLISLIAPLSPALASALSGPMSVLALAALGRALAQDDEASADQIAAALAGGAADAELKIRHAEAEYLRASGQTSVELARIQAQAQAHGQDTLAHLETIAANDRAQARQRQMETNDQTNRWLAYGVTIGFFAVLLYLLYVASTGGTLREMPVLYTLLGVLGTGWTGIVAFYFGSSVGSKEKTALLGESAVPPKKLDV